MSHVQITHLKSIQLTAEELSDFTPHLAASYEIDAPAAPQGPACVVGWRDRWWLNNRPGQQVSISYWLFASDEHASVAADRGRPRLSARTVKIQGRYESIYQPPEETGQLTEGQIWQADHNFLFVRHNVVVLVAEFGKHVSQDMTLTIARRILEKVVSS